MNAARAAKEVILTHRSGHPYVQCDLVDTRSALDGSSKPDAVVGTVGNGHSSHGPGGGSGGNGDALGRAEGWAGRGVRSVRAEPEGAGDKGFLLVL